MQSQTFIAGQHASLESSTASSIPSLDALARDNHRVADALRVDLSHLAARAPA